MPEFKISLSQKTVDALQKKSFSLAWTIRTRIR